MESSRDDVVEDSSSEKESPESSSSAQITANLQMSVSDLQKVIHPDYVRSEDIDPLSAAKRTGPRVYTITNHHDENIRFLTFGCQGDKKAGQRKVADHIKKIMSERPNCKPDFIVLLGDNFYPNGVDSADDKRFIDQFYDMYGIRCFVVAGNHDFGFTNEEKINYSSSTPAGKARAMHQVSHSYALHDGDPALAISKPEFWRQPELDLALLPKWNMPWLFYSVIIGNLQLFFLDSNHFADDYLTMIESKEVSPNENQVAWLTREFKACKEAGRTPILFQHHPLIDISKRARYGDGDATLYFKHEPDRWSRLAAHFSLDKYDYKYDSLLAKIHAKLGIKFAACFAAHVHAMYNVISSEICQFVVGSGGGKLQSRASFKQHEQVGFFLEELGFMSFACNKKSPNIMNITAFSLAGHELALTNARVKPITKILDRDTTELYSLVLQACNEHAAELAALVSAADKLNKPNIEFYPYYLAKTRNLLHEPALHDVDGMHEIIAHFCQPTLSDFQLTLNRLEELMQKLTQRGEGSLFEKINRSLKRSRFGKTVQELLDMNITSAESRAIKPGSI